MPRSEAILALLDSRSFDSIWFWALVVLVWAMVGRRVLGVPADVIAGLGRAAPGDEAAALALLDWLSLTLPRWRLSPREGTVLLGLGAFALSALLVLGFGYGLELAQALVLLVLPLALVLVLDLRLAGRLRLVLAQAETGQPVHEAGHEAARLMRRHRALVAGISAVAVALTAFFAAIWMILHPFGF
ncbi:hypothetical protein [Paracoccus sp. (in: a-proteobacteria)]|uniref:hypothetical protein n=1 Tax=Paracoccus sp. TaxID=267 RepID=UPI00321F9D97